MSAISVFVSQRPQLRLFGVFVRTSMSKASVDCPKLWANVFGPRMHEISGAKLGEYPGPSYGISVMLDEHNFDYWAAMPAREGQVLPEGMQVIELPAGLYAGCVIPSLAQLGEAFTYLYGTWPQTVKDYALNMQAPGFEYYDQRYQESGALEVYAPVLKI